MSHDLFWMRRAIEIAGNSGEDCPVGCVIVHNGCEISSSCNMVERRDDPIAHSEILCIRSACKSLGSRYLSGCTLYCTLEPCQMCDYAIKLARIDKVIFGSFRNDGSIFKNEVVGGVLENECTKMMSDFFKNVRRAK